MIKFLVAIMLTASACLAADLTITAANVRHVAGRITTVASVPSSTAAGKLLMLQTGTWQTAQQASDKDGDPVEDLGIALATVSSVEHAMPIQLDGTIDIGATTVKETLYVASIGVNGNIAPVADFDDSGTTLTMFVVGVASDTVGTLDLIMQQVDVATTSGIYD